jgi:hypothetical protein
VGQVADFNDITAKNYINIALLGCNALLVDADSLSVEHLRKFARPEAKDLMKLTKKEAGRSE